MGIDLRAWNGDSCGSLHSGLFLWRNRGGNELNRLGRLDRLESLDGLQSLDRLGSLDRLESLEGLGSLDGLRSLDSLIGWEYETVDGTC